MKTGKIIAVVVLSLLSSFAVAGYVQPQSVTVTLNGDGSGSAIGDMVTARFSDNDVEVIGCGTRAYDDGAGGIYRWGFCQATDALEQQVICNTENPDLLDIMASTSDYSFITFSWDAGGICNHIGFSTQSFYIPEHAGTPGRGRR